jgi:hypothetical protein
MAEIFLCSKYLLSTVCWSLRIHRIKFVLCCLSRLDLHFLSVSTQYYCKITKKCANLVSGSNSVVFLVVLLFSWYTFRCDSQYRRDFWGQKNCCCPSVIRSVNVFKFICISSHSDMHSHEIVRHATSSK